MFRMWAKIFQNNHMLKDICIEDGSDDTRTHKVFHSLDEVCHQFDLGTPIWLDMNIADFKRHNKTRFTQDSFVVIQSIKNRKSFCKQRKPANLPANGFRCFIVI